MNFIKKLLFILSLIALYQSVKIDAQNGECGGTYTRLSGTISSPNYPSNYSNDLHCDYNIQMPPLNSAVNITFTSFDTEPIRDYLQVFCLSDSTKAVPQFSGTNVPAFLSLNPCNNVQLHFTTDSSGASQGFSLRYDIGNGSEGGLTMKPVNAYVSDNSTEPIVLSCSGRANHPDANLWWSFSTYGTEEYWFRVITAPDCSVSSSLDYSNPMCISTSRHDSIATCNLTISPSYIKSTAGIYSCTDITLDYARALVTYIEPSFTGVDLNSSGTDVVRGDQISLTCNVQFFPTTMSYHQLLTTSIYIYSDDNPRPISVSNTTASITVSVSPEVVPTYVCNINFTFSSSPLASNYATNLPQSISMMIPSRPVLYWPENTSMVIRGDDNGRVIVNGILSCFVPANPPATYQWTNEETRLMWNESAVTMSNNGTYTCIATNIIRGKTYKASKSISVTIIGYQKDNSALIVGVVLGIVLLLLLVVAIVQFVLLRRKKHSAAIAAADANYDYIDASTRTDSDPAKPHVYQLTHRETLDVGQGGAVATAGNKDAAHMYEKITDQTYDQEIHREHNSQSYLTLSE